MRLDQLLVTGAPGDAITTAALDIRRLLRSIGASEIYARNIHPELAGEVLPLEGYRASRRPSEDILIFHASIGEPKVHEFVMGRRERLVLVYHNISPSPPFVPFDPRFAGLLDEGRRELAELRDRVACALAVSEFNAGELVALGFADVRVAPLVVDVSRLRQLAPDPDTTVRLAEAWDGPMLLFVGQLLPHKRPDLLVQAFHVLQTYLLPEARLALVGASRLP
nr:group 1 glycosyl transferase [Actinomycetota bacterium]